VNVSAGNFLRGLPGLAKTGGFSKLDRQFWMPRAMPRGLWTTRGLWNATRAAEARAEINIAREIQQALLAARHRSYHLPLKRHGSCKPEKLM